MIRTQIELEMIQKQLDAILERHCSSHINEDIYFSIYKAYVEVGNAIEQIDKIMETIETSQDDCKNQTNNI